MLAIARKSGIVEAGGVPAAVKPAAADDDEMLDVADLGEPSQQERADLRQLLGLLRDAASVAPTGGDANPKLQVLRHYLREVVMVQGLTG